MSTTITVTKTVTEQIRETPTKVIPLKLCPHGKKVAVENKLNDLLLRLRNSGVFTGDELDQLTVWETEFYRDYLTDLATEENQENVSMALCYLQENIIFAVFDDRYCTAPTAQQDQFLAFEDALKEILELTVPVGTEVADFISAYSADNEVDRSFSSRIALVHLFFQAKQEQLYNSASAAEMKLIQDYNTHCVSLEEIVAEKEAAGGDAIAAVGDLAAKIERVYSSLLQQERLLGEKMEQQERHEDAFQNTLKNCEAIILRGAHS